MKRKTGRPPNKETFYFRPRIHDLLLSASKHGVVTVVAGPGFGKTEAVTAFARKMEQSGAARVMGISIREEDNDPEQFRLNVRKAFEIDFADIPLRPSDSPSSDPIGRTKDFAEHLNRRFSPKEKYIFIIDNFERLKNVKLHQLIDSLVSLFQINHVCWIVISRSKRNMELAGLKAKRGISEITQRQLEFTRDEIDGYFTETGMGMTAEQIDTVMEETQGWPLAVAAMRQMYEQQEDYTLNTFFNYISIIFESEYFYHYSENIQMLLMLLSVIKVFSVTDLQGLAQKLEIDTKELKRVIVNHPFIHFNYALYTFRLHKVYQNYLLIKEFQLAEDKKDGVLRVAGETFYERQEPIEAVLCFDHIKDHERTLQILDELTLYQYDVDTLQNLKRIFEDFPAAFRCKNPLIQLLTAYTELYRVEVDSAYGHLVRLKERLQGKTDDKSLAMLGETYLLLATISIMRHETDFAGYFKKAAEVFPSRYRKRNDIFYLFVICHKFFLKECRKGEVERLIQLTSSAVPYIECFQNGAGTAFSIYFAQEAAYCMGNFPLAEKLALQYLYNALENGLSYAVIHGRWRLIQIYYLTGNYNEILKQKELIFDQQENNIEPICLFYREQVDIFLNVLLEDFSRLPRWFTLNKNIETSRLPIYLNLEGTIYGYYLLYTGQYIELVQYLEWFENHYRVTGAWLERIRSKLLRAVAHMKLDNKVNALQLLWEAYQMTYHNRIMAPFTSLGKDMRTLIGLASADNRYPFDKAWLNLVRQKATTFAKQLSLMKKKNAIYRKEGPWQNNLTKREMEVLSALAQGLTQEEIAGMMHIAVSTAKTVIKQIYNKLGAVNNAAAVRIAYESGIFTVSHETDREMSSAG